MKIICLLLIILTLTLVGCTQEANVEDPINDPKDIVSDQETGYVLNVNGTEIALHAEAAPILDALVEPMDSFEAPSCAFDGMDRVYLYNGFEIHTYENDGVDCVSAIIILDDSIATKEGIYIYSKLDEVLDAYGEDYTENFGLYTYEQNRSKITFLVENDEVVAIEYIAIP